MKTKIFLFATLAIMLAAGALLLSGQDIIGIVSGRPGQKLRLAVPDFRGAGAAQPLMNTFNTTLWDELDASGVLTLVAKSVYPLNVPQRPEDFVPPSGRGPSNGMWLTDWSGPPVSANNLAFGYTAEQDGKLLLIGNLYNLSQPTPATASLLAKRYIGSLDQNGAKDIARQFAADILALFGGKTLSGTKIYFVSDRTGPLVAPDGKKVPIKEIWAMDYDGSNQRQVTFYKGDSMDPTVSPDGKILAFASIPQGIRDGHIYDGTPIINLQSLETGKKLTFYNPVSSIVATPEFTPDGKHLLFGTKIGADKDENIYMSNLQGGELTRVSRVSAIDEEPRVNPKTGADMVFISGRTGHPQLWKMNVDGGGAEMLTSGEGDVANPSWRPDGQWVAFTWTRGYEYGQFNIFIMDVVSHQIIQLTHDTGDNENPSWAPDGLHIVYSSKRGRSTQIFTMLADGTHVRQLTTQGTQGNNGQPMWTKGIN